MAANIQRMLLTVSKSVTIDLNAVDSTEVVEIMDELVLDSGSGEGRQLLLQIKIRVRILIFS